MINRVSADKQKSGVDPLKYKCWKVVATIVISHRQGKKVLFSCMALENGKENMYFDAWRGFKRYVAIHF